MERPSFLIALSAALNEEIDASALAPLPDSDALMNSFRNGYRAGKAPSSYRRFFPLREAVSVFTLAESLAGRITEQVYFLTKRSEDCGAVRVSLAALLKHAKSVINLDGDCLQALS